jgi:hypothetical protein
MLQATLTGHDDTVNGIKACQEDDRPSIFKIDGRTMRQEGDCSACTCRRSYERIMDCEREPADLGYSVLA